MADDSGEDIVASSSNSGGQLGASMTSLDAKTSKLTSSTNAYAKALTAAFAQGVTGAKSFDTVLSSLGQRISTLSLTLALKPLTSALGSGIEKLFGGLTSSGTGTGGTQAFAQGGVVASPSFFPLSGGRLGLAGESGPEAILPLTRGSDGSLGVASQGGGGGSVTVNITTPDADSFRRSDTYLTGMIARAVTRGQRGM